MTLNEFMEVYTGNACISIAGYCEEEHYDFYGMPDEAEEDFAGDNPNHYIPSCLARESLYEEIKDCEVKHISIIGGDMDKTELCIELKERVNEN